MAEKRFLHLKFAGLLQENSHDCISSLFLDLNTLQAAQKHLEQAALTNLVSKNVHKLSTADE